MVLSNIFFDTNLFIYLVEDHPIYAPKVSALLGRMEARRDQILTSVLTIGEVLIKPIAAGDLALAEKYELVLTHPEIRVGEFDQPAARRYAEIRRDRSIRPPDAIQLAVAACLGTDLFITNDESLARKIVPGIQFISSLDRVPI